MSINVPVLLIWLQLIFSLAGVAVLAAWFLTGRKNAALRILGAVFILISLVITFFR